jgi:PGF-pre-PGF domain-containing protein
MEKFLSNISLTKNYLSLLGIIGITILASLFLVSLIFADYGDLAPSYSKAGVNITMLWFNVTNNSSTSNTLINITIDQTGTAAGANITAVRILNETNDIVNESSNPTFPITLGINLVITEMRNFTIQFELNSSATDGVTIQANVTDIGAEVNVSYSTPPYTSGITTIDITPPTITFTTPTTQTGNYSQDWIVANVTASDSLSGVDTITIYLYNSTGLVQSNTSSVPFSINFTNLQDGTYYLNATVNDTVNNLNNTETRTILLDTTPPITTDNAPAGWQSAAFNVTLTCNDAGSGCSVTSYRVDGGAWQSGTIVEITTDGNHTIEYNSTDAVGNVETTKTTYAALDTTPPVVTINFPQPNQFYKWIIDLNITVIDSGIGVNNNSVFYQVLNASGDNITPYSQMANFSATTFKAPLNISILLDGYYNITFNASDLLNWTNSTERVQIKVDNKAPILIVPPKNFTDVSTAIITFTANLTDIFWGSQNINSSTITMEINSSDNTLTSQKYQVSSYNSTTGLASFSFPLNFTSPFFNPGPHFVRVCANDTINNQNCTWSPAPFIIKVANASQIEQLISSALNGTVNITYENGTDVGSGTNIPGINPVAYNYTLNINISNFEIKIVGFSINETLVSKMNNTNVTLNLQTINELIQNITQNLTNIVSVWVDVNEWLPSEALYKYGEVILNTSYDSIYYCPNQTNCSPISECSSTVNLTNYNIIPNNSACYLDNLGDGKTHVYLSSFSGVAGAKDPIAPSISFSCSPTSVYIWETITCSCSATDNLDPNPQVSYTVHPPTNAVGIFTTTCTAIDSAGNKNSSSISYTVSSRPSGGGGGTYTQIIKQIGIWGEITPGTLAIMKITKSELPLKQIQIEVKNPANNVKITVTKLEGKPAAVEHEISGKVYKYVEINAENLDEKLERAKIQFEVTKAWISENNLDKNKIYLFRYTTKWEKLDTKLINESEDYISYEAETPGFSYFAIAGEEVEEIKICEEGKKRCHNNNLEQCKNNSWQILETCKYGCNLTLLKCNPKPIKITKICNEGEKRCLDNELQICKNNSWQTLEICNYGCNLTTLTCNPEPIIEEEKKDYTWLIIAIVIVIIILGLLYIKKFF